MSRQWKYWFLAAGLAMLLASCGGSVGRLLGKTNDLPDPDKVIVTVTGSSYAGGVATFGVDADSLRRRDMEADGEGGAPLEFRWDFWAANPNAEVREGTIDRFRTGSLVTAALKEAGSFAGHLTIRVAGGGDSIVVPFEYSVEQGSGLPHPDSKPFALSIGRAVKDTEVTFKLLATNSSVVMDSAWTYLWDFSEVGTPQRSTEQMPKVVIDRAARLKDYEIRLVLSDASGASEEYEFPFKIEPLAAEDAAIVSIAPLGGGSGDTVTLTSDILRGNALDSDDITILWDLHGGGKALEPADQQADKIVGHLDATGTKIQVNAVLGPGKAEPYDGELWIYKDEAVLDQRPFSFIVTDLEAEVEDVRGAPGSEATITYTMKSGTAEDAVWAFSGGVTPTEAAPEDASITVTLPAEPGTYPAILTLTNRVPDTIDVSFNVIVVAGEGS